MNKQLKEKIKESVASVLPITFIVLLLSITLVPMEAGVMVLFMIGAILLIIGMGLFTLGVDMSMIPMGDGIGVKMSSAKHMITPIILCFVLGVIVTIAEPDLQVLANQIPAIPNMTLILVVALGVGIFLTLAFLRILLQIRLSVLLVICYVIVFTIAGFSANEFIPAAFDSGGVTTGPITVPFIMAFGIGLSTLRSDKDSSNDSFGLVALCSIGPILAVLLLGIFYKPEMTNTESVPIVVSNTVEAARAFRFELPHYIKEISIALFPIILIFAVFQLVSHRYRKKKLIKILVGFFLTYVGLILFLTGVNVGFMPAGELLGEQLAEGKTRYLLVPIGMLVGYFIVSAEPAVHVLKTQVEEISNGMISQKAIGNSLSIGVAASVGLSMIRLLTGINIMWLLIPGYAIALVLSFFVPPIYTGVAFDSGGVASGPMTATFLLPFAMGACKTLGGNLMIDAFGTVAMVAMTPLITIQVLGFHAEYKSKLERRLFKRKLDKMDDVIWYFED